MSLPILDLTGGSVRVIGNRGDTHTFRLGNPSGEVIITNGAEFEADFESSLGVVTDVTIDTSQQDDGILQIPVVIESGVYRVRRLNPQQTCLTARIEVK